MRKYLVMVTGVWMALAGGVTAQSSPVVVELFTSQGCSSCPPADEFLAELAKRDDVIALSLHVDYWDYIGWKDVFADPKFTDRQHAYARAAGKRMVYTPQMVIAGQEHVVGTKPGEVSRLIKARGKIPDPVKLSVTRKGNRLEIMAEPLQEGLGRMVVQMVRFKSGEKVRIKRGENAGRDLFYVNVVTDWEVLKEWNGRSPLSIAAKITGDDDCVIIIQRASHGPVLAAARVR